MKDKIKLLKEQIKEKLSLAKQLKTDGNENRAYSLFSEAQKMTSELANMNKYLKL